MRTFSANEPFEPVQMPPAASDANTLPEKYQPMALVVIGVIFIGIALFLWLATDGTSRLLSGFVCVAAGVLAIAGSRALRPGGRRPKAVGNPAMMGIGALVLILLTCESVREAGFSGSKGIVLMTLAWVALFVIVTARAHQERKVADLMRASVLPNPSGDTKSPAAPGETLGPARVAPPMRLDVYLQGELPALPMRYITPVSTDLNIIGLPPRRILYLYNFFSPETLVQKVKGNWRRFGPVFFLGSPGDFSFGHTFDRSIGASVSTAILASPGAFDARLASATETVLSPGDQNLTDVSHFSGGYPQHLFLCNDGSWRHGVEQLFNRAEVVLLDASDYDVQRAGLNWEIGRLVNLVSMRNVVILVDKGTDQTALCAAFREAWQSMDGRSPNNQPDAGPVRWVVLDLPNEREQSREPPAALPPEADPLGLYPKLNPVLKQLCAGHYRDALIDDRIFGLLIELNPLSVPETPAPPSDGTSRLRSS